MEREWRDALLITEPSACSWTASNSTGSWAEERERGEGEMGAGIQSAREMEKRGRERETMLWVGGAKGAEGRIDGKKMNALMI